ncbi:MAG: acyl carrier protein [Deltaproteobacteria bacterium]|jgi:acyl carrier protein|nr:MAG: acyl carrier protein [Deltaproteobacteria bacterium]
MSVQDQVMEIIANQLSVAKEEVTPQASFIDDLGADSLDLVELVMAMEEKFSVDIADEDAEKMKTVQDAISYIQAQQK